MDGVCTSNSKINPESRLRNADELYEQACHIVAKNISEYGELLELIPVQVIVDVYKKAYDFQLSTNLQRQLSNLQFFEKLLKHSFAWSTLHKCLHLVLQKERDFAFFLASQKVAELERIRENIYDDEAYKISLLKFLNEAVILGTFFSEAGLYDCACLIYRSCEVSDLNGNIDEDLLEISFDIAIRTAQVSTLDGKFDDANKSIFHASILRTYLKNTNKKMNCAFLYSICSSYFFALSQYDKAFNLAHQGILELNRNIPSKVTIDVLRQSCKTCIIKRRFKKAHMYIKSALCLAKQWFGDGNTKFADCLSDYAFYLLNVDMVGNAVVFYKLALDTRLELFGEDNVITGITHEDLAYAIYVRNYSSGNFKEARYHAEWSVKTLTDHLPSNHLTLSSCKRVKALILEEIALDSSTNEFKLLREAEELHMEALNLAKQSFGENNVQTAKHYGNLGRLYQSMRKFEEAEKHHKTAIEIKERLLGKEDYEVALSIGHLASLYNYDMEKYDLAEKLYERAIAIGHKLFGLWYSGLEYDYRGLIHLYHETGQYNLMSQYQMSLADWEEEKEKVSNKSDAVMMAEDDNTDFSIDGILKMVKESSQQQIKKSCKTN